MQFLDVSPELGNSYNEVIAPQDVATYGGLCALASFDRSELKAFIPLRFFSLVVSFWFQFPLIHNSLILCDRQK